MQAHIIPQAPAPIYVIINQQPLAHFIPILLSPQTGIPGSLFLLPTNSPQNFFITTYLGSVPSIPPPAPSSEPLSLQASTPSQEKTKAVTQKDASTNIPSRSSTPLPTTTTGRSRSYSKKNSDSDDEKILSKDIVVIPHSSSSRSRSNHSVSYSRSSRSVSRSSTSSSRFRFFSNNSTSRREDLKKEIISKLSNERLSTTEIINVWKLLETNKFQKSQIKSSHSSNFFDLLVIKTFYILKNIDQINLLNILFSLSNLGFLWQDFDVKFQKQFSESILENIELFLNNNSGNQSYLPTILRRCSMMEIPDEIFTKKLRTLISDKILKITGDCDYLSKDCDLKQQRVTLIDCIQSHVYYNWISNEENIDLTNEFLSAIKPSPHSSYFHKEVSRILSQITDYKFTNEVFINGHFVDILFKDFKLIIEANGPYHYDEDGAKNFLTAYYDRLDKKANYAKCTVHYADWHKLKTDNEKREFLMNLLKDSSLFREKRKNGGEEYDSEHRTKRHKPGSCQ